MESDPTLRDLEQAAAAPFITYPTVPAWYPPLVGAYAAAIPAAIMLGKRGHNTLAAGVVLAAVVSLVSCLVWYRSRWGTWPRVEEAPTEIKTAYTWFASTLFVPMALSGLTALAGVPILTVAVTFIAFTAFIWQYEKIVYPGAARRVRERLA